MTLIGRIEEKQQLDRLLNSKNAEFLAIYGRRRIGKTFLIREHFKRQLCFELTGVKDGILKEQLQYFNQEIGKRSRKSYECPGSWQDAFQQLEQYLTGLRGKGKRVIFFDELPWLASPRSRFLQALDHFWNTVLSRDSRFILVICGSAASWMISKVIENKGGLHNRLTSPPIRLEPFSLAESELFLKSQGIKNISHYDQLILAMVMGGVPHYLKEAIPGRSATQIIDNVCFSKTGLLRNEFERLYSSLFENAERHIEIVYELAKHPQGLTRSALTKVYASGGRLTQTLRELEEAGFISTHQPFDKKSKDTTYRLTDEYTLFYLKWIKGRRENGPGTFLKLSQKPGWRAWSGYALESLAHKHIGLIKQELGIEQVDTKHCSWVHHANKTWPDGAQVDLLLDRADGTINLIEVKFSQGPFTITKKYAEELRRKVQVFRDVTGTKKTIFLTLLTTNGCSENVYAKELVDVSLQTECLFK